MPNRILLAMTVAALLAGPLSAQGSLSISGKIFFDADLSGSRTTDEPGIPDIDVVLLDVNGLQIGVHHTLQGGDYLFDGLGAGTYTVEVPTDSVNPGASNEDLRDYFFPTTPTSFTLDLTTSSSRDQHIGYHLDCDELLIDFDPLDPDGDGRVFEGLGKTIGYWKHQFDVAITGQGTAQVPPAVLQVYLDEIEDGRLARKPFRRIPFQFDDLDEFGDALSIMASTSSDEVDLLMKQLLAAELNYVSGCGLTNHLMVEKVTLMLAEYIVERPSNFPREEILCVKDILDAMNNTGEAGFSTR